MTSWVLLRGWGREARHWGRFPAELARTLPGARIVALDLPGNGRHAAMRSPSSVEAMAEALRREQLATPVHLVGLSLGAMVSIEWARRHPNEVAGCVLINTSLRPFSPFYERLRPRNYATLARLVFFEPDTEAREAAILRLTSAALPNAALLSEWKRYADERPVSRANLLRQLLAAARYRAPASPPPVPLLLLASRQDHLVNFRCSLSLAQRWRVPIAVHPGAGHDLALDDGAWVAARVSEWLKPT